MSEIQEKLQAPFDQHFLKFFPGAISRDKTKGLVMVYADARAYMDRLDTVMGAANWSTSYRIVDDGAKAVECTLSLRFGESWVSKANVGFPNEGKDADNADKEPLKAAYSDALKRACVEWGVGRFLYDLKLKQDWLPVDEYGKFKEQPVILGQSAKLEPTPQPVRAVEPKPAAAKTKKEVQQWGTFITGSGEFDTEKWLEAQRPVKAQIADLTGGDVKKWLADNASKSLDDLIEAAKKGTAA